MPNISFSVILRKGWGIVRNNLWLFWVILGLKFLILPDRILFQYIYFKSKHPDQPFFDLFHSTFFSLPSWSGYLSGVLIRSFKSFYFYFDAAQGIIPGIFLCMLSFFMIKRFRKLPATLISAKFQPEAVFFKKNFYAFIVVNFLLLLNYAFMFFSQFCGKEFLLQTYCSILLGSYWSVIVGSLAAGFILNLFRGRVEGKKSREGGLLMSSLKFFRPLFFFYLMYFSFTIIVYYLPVLILNYGIGQKLPVSRYLYYAVQLFPVLFLMVPFSIVGENVCWKEGFKHGFIFWKRNFRQTFFLTIIVMFFLWLGKCVYFLIPFSSSCIAGQAIMIALRTFVTFFITAFVTVFCFEVKKQERCRGN